MGREVSRSLCPRRKLPAAAFTQSEELVPTACGSDCQHWAEASSSTVSVTERQPLHALYAMCDVGLTCRTVRLFSLLPGTPHAQWQLLLEADMGCVLASDWLVEGNPAELSLSLDCLGVGLHVCSCAFATEHRVQVFWFD